MDVCGKSRAMRTRGENRACFGAAPTLLIMHVKRREAAPSPSNYNQLLAALLAEQEFRKCAAITPEVNTGL